LVFKGSNTFKKLLNNQKYSIKNYPFMKSNFYLLISIFLMLGSLNSFAQIGIGTKTPAPSAALEVSSTTNNKGILIPRVTAAQKDAIVSPAEGLMIFQTTAPAGFYYYTSGAWKLIISQTDLASGNAGTATKLASPRNINAVAFDGSADITVPAAAETLTGIVAIANGGTNSTATATAGGIGYGTGTEHAYTGAGTFGQLLSSNGAGVPTWITPSNGGIPYTGATAAVDLGAYDLKVNGMTVGRGLNGSKDSNVGIGKDVLRSVTGGSYLTSVGYESLYSNTTGYNNTAVGSAALKANTSGLANTAIGSNSLSNNTNADFNTAVGNHALRYNTTGDDNTASGAGALESNTNGQLNSAFGRNTLYSNTTGSDNTAIGAAALYSNLSGHQNIAIGVGALRGNTTGSDNTANGFKALYSNTAGNGLTAYGGQALYSNTSGQQNTAIGNAALNANTTGSDNTSIGRAALRYNTTGIQNTANGRSALSTNTTGSNNTALGYAADVASDNLSNATAIGNGAIVAVSNTIQLGNTAVTNVKTSGTITAGAVTYPKVDGTAGQVLTANANGIPTWAAASSGGVHTIGESYGGGIVFYVYDGGKHGLIAAISDQSTGIRWNGISYIRTSANANGVGAGLKNTMLIIAKEVTANSNGDPLLAAATVCNEYSVTETVGGISTTFGDWYLPSRYELNLLYIQKTVVGGFAADSYWSSSESGNARAYYQNFNTGVQSFYFKDEIDRVRAIRAF
jgi:hypothetical protein